MSVTFDIEALNEASDTLEDIQADIDDLTDEAENAGDETSDSMDDASDSMDGASDSASLLSGNLGNIAGKAAQVGAAVVAMGAEAVKAIGVKSVQAAGEFDDAITQAAVKTRGAGSAIDELKQSAKEVGQASTRSATQAAGGLQFLAQAGLSAQESIEAIPEATELAAAGNLDLAQASDIATNVMSGMRLEVDELGRVNDRLVATASNANTSVGELGQAFSFVAPKARAVGLSVEETSAVLGQLANAGIKSTRAGRGLRSTLARLQNPTAKTKEVLDNLGVSARNSSGQIKSFVQILKELEAAGATGKQLSKAFSNVGGTVVEALKPALGDLEELESKIASSEGAAAQQAETMRSSMGKQMKILRGSVETLAITIGEELKPAVVETSKVLTDFANAASGAISEDENTLLSDFATVAKDTATALRGLKIAADQVGGFGQIVEQNTPRIFGDVAAGIHVVAEEVRNYRKTQAKAKAAGDSFVDSAESVKSAFMGIGDAAESVAGKVQGFVGGVADEIQDMADRAQSAQKTSIAELRTEIQRLTNQKIGVDDALKLARTDDKIKNLQARIKEMKADMAETEGKAQKAATLRAEARGLRKKGGLGVEEARPGLQQPDTSAFLGGFDAGPSEAQKRGAAAFGLAESGGGQTASLEQIGGRSEGERAARKARFARAKQAAQQAEQGKQAQLQKDLTEDVAAQQSQVTQEMKSANDAAAGLVSTLAQIPAQGSRAAQSMKTMARAIKGAKGVAQGINTALSAVSSFGVAGGVLASLSAVAGVIAPLFGGDSEKAAEASASRVDETITSASAKNRKRATEDLTAAFTASLEASKGGPAGGQTNVFQDNLFLEESDRIAQRLDKTASRAARTQG